MIAATLRATGANPENLVVELTESTAVDNIEAVAEVLEELARLGVRSAMDDFGTGYCGLRYLASLPVATLKIDRSFVQGDSDGAAAVVAATIAMGHSLGMTVVGEGVETEEQEQTLLELGCDRIQGYRLGRPAPAGQLLDRLLAEQTAAAQADGASAQRVTPSLRSTAIDRRAVARRAVSSLAPTLSAHPA
jgi:EAL domain-containing protein (putative c-di-GMP-specific phosphodiesterase class I)